MAGPPRTKPGHRRSPARVLSSLNQFPHLLFAAAHDDLFVFIDAMDRPKIPNFGGQDIKLTHIDPRILFT